MHPIISHRFGSALLYPIFSIILLALIWTLHLPVAAFEDDIDDENPPITLSMEAFLADQQPPQNLMPMPLTPCVGGMAGSYPCNNVDMLAFLPLSSIGGGSGNDIWGWTDPMDGTEYAIMGRTNGTAFVDLSDPENPVYLGNLPSHTGSSSWRDIKTYADHAFIVSDSNGSHGMQVFDLTQLRNVVTPPVTFSETAHYSGVGSAHNVVINEDSGYAFIVGASSCSGGLHMVDISTPTNPTFAGCFSDDGYTHDAQCVIYNGPDVTHVGQEICLNANVDTLTIADVTNKAAPVQLSSTGYAGSGYTHQGWLTEDHTYFLLDDELDESSFGHNTRTYIWDVSDLDNPNLIGNYTASTAAIDHNLYVKGDYAFQSNYRAGLRILDISDIANANLFEEAYFDIYPSSDSVGFNGSWSNYPYFDSGIVIVSGIEQGLFILQPTSLTADFSLNAAPDTSAVCTPDDAVYTVDVGAFAGFGAAVTLSANGQPNPPDSAVFSTNNTPPPFTSTLTIGTNGATAGAYNIDVVGMSPTTTHTTTVELILDTTPPGTPTLTSPADGETGVPTSPTFEWTAVANSTEYYLEVATDTGFSNIVYTATVAAPAVNHTAATSLNPDTLYYWRVTAQNGCGGGTAATPFSFTTGSLVCTVYNSADVPQLIPPSGTSGTTTSLLNIPDSGTIVDVNVLNLVGTHTWIGDLEFYIESPAATAVQIHDNICGSADDFNLNYDDEATPGSVPCPPTTGGTYQPFQPLSTFDGQEANGDWTLRIEDQAGGDSGQLDSWSLEVCYIPALTAPEIMVAPDNLSSSQFPGTQVVQTLTISNTGDADLAWDIFEDDSSFSGGSWSDDFDSYATGSQMHGQGGWKGWDNNSAFGALTSSAQALSAPNSVDIVGASDLVHEYSGYTSGQWIFTAWQYLPLGYSGQSYFILLNTYNDGGPYNWSTQVQFDSTSGQVISDFEGATLPLITGQWVELRVEIDLDANQQTFYYDGQLLTQKSWTEGVSGGGALNIAAVDLFANGATSVYYDDLSLAPPVATCDAPDDIPWVTVNPISGTVPAAAADLVNVTFDSTSLASAVYTGTLCVNSNDTVTPLVEVPLQLTVLSNQVPVAAADAYTTTQDVTLAVPAPGVLTNDSDGDGHPLTAVLDTNPSSGTLNFSADGAFIYTPTIGFEGNDTFTYHADDGLDASNVATVTITVLNTPPIAVADAYTTTQDVTLAVPASGVLANDSDGDGDSLTAVLDSAVTSGTLNLNADGSFVYTPTAGFAGADTFTYHAHDGSDDSNVVTVTITVTERAGQQLYLPVIRNSSSQASTNSAREAAAGPGGAGPLATLALLPIAVGLWFPSRKFGRLAGDT